VASDARSTAPAAKEKVQGWLFKKSKALAWSTPAWAGAGELVVPLTVSVPDPDSVVYPASPVMPVSPILRVKVAASTP